MPSPLMLISFFPAMLAGLVVFSAPIMVTLGNGEHLQLPPRNGVVLLVTMGLDLLVECLVLIYFLLLVRIIIFGEVYVGNCY